jgi:hypothetical protein
MRAKQLLKLTINGEKREVAAYTDLDFSWRRSMVEVWVRRTLEEAARCASRF